MKSKLIILAILLAVVGGVWYTQTQLSFGIVTSQTASSDTLNTFRTNVNSAFTSLQGALSAASSTNPFMMPYFVATSTTATSSAANGWNLTGGCFALNGSCITSGSGSNNIATSSSETSGQLAYWTSTNATPATLGKVATTSVTCSGGATCTSFTAIGSSPITISAGGGGGAGGWTFITGAIYNATTTDQVLIAENATTTNAQFEVAGRFAAFKGGFLSLASSTVTGLTNLNGGATTTLLSAQGAFFGTAGTSVFTTGGFLGLASSTPWTQLSLGSGAITTTEASTTGTATINVNWKNANQQKIEMTANTTVQMGFNTVPGQTQKIILCSDVSARSVTWGSSSTTIIWAGHTVPTQTSSANTCDVYSFVVTGATGTPTTFGAVTSNF